MNNYKVVFRGEIQLNQSPEQVQDNIVRLFKIQDPKKVEALFSGKQVTIKQGLTEEKAKAFQKAIENAGALCEVVSSAPPAPAATDTEGNATGSGLSLSLVPIDSDKEKEESESSTAEGTEEQGIEQASQDDYGATEISIANRGHTKAIPRQTAPQATEDDDVEDDDDEGIEHNSSGTGAAAEIPPGVKGWSWGAFLLNWIWAIGNQTWIGLLAHVHHLDAQIDGPALRGM